MKRILTNTIVVLMATLAMISCKSSETVDPTVTLSDQTITLTQKDTYQLTAELSDYSHDYVVWASNNSEVASVSQEGLVTAIAPGTAEITAKCEYGKNRQTCTVTVNPIYVTSIKLDKETIKNTEGQTEKLTVTFTPADATYQTISWTSSDESIAKVKDGVVTSVSEGTAVITATTGKGATAGAALTASCTVNVKKSQNFISWQDDKAGSKAFDIYADPATSKAGAINFDGTKITWTANETGKPRIDSLTLSNGSRIVITQFEEKDLIGDYVFTSKVFAGTGAKVSAGTTPVDVKFEVVQGVEGIKDAEGTTHVNNIKITGLFDTMVLNAALEINYDSKTAKLGVFLDTRDGIGQPVGSQYGTFFPGLCTESATAWGKPWLYSETELGDPDYTWLWFDWVLQDNTFLLKNRSSANIPMQAVTQYKNQTMNKMCGFGVVLSDSNVFNNSTVKSYSNFFQFNPSGASYDGEYFKKK